MPPTDLPLDYTVGFTITPKELVGEWANIIHVSATGNNCCNYGDRIPAIWFYANTYRLHIRDGHAANGNAGCDPEEQLPLNEVTNVRMVMTATTVEVLYNGVSKCSQAGRDRTNFDNIQVYAADPWHETLSLIHI